jgi:hypothetical protein
MVDYSGFSCERLDTEARRLEQLIAHNANSYHSGVREKLSVMRGQADAVDKQIATKGCHVLPVDLTISKPHHAHKSPTPTAVSY